MRPILCSIAALPAALLAQEAVRVEVDAPRSWVLAARTMKVEARAYSDLGELVATDMAFASSNPAVASVDALGLVTGVTPGKAEIEARGGGASGSVTVWVHPSRIRLDPGRLEIETGQTATLTARALDADGNAVVTAGFRWLTSFPSVAAVESGLVRGVGAGTATITAILALADSSLSFSGQVQVSVRPRPDYRFERWHTSSQNPAPITVKSIESFSYAGTRIGGRASLSNGGQAVVVHDGSEMRVLAMSGQVLEGTGREILLISDVAVNSRGDAAAVVDSDAFPHSIAFFRQGRAGLSADVMSVQSVSAQCCACCAAIGPRALSAEGDLGFLAWNNGRTGLYYRRGNGAVEQVNLDNLPAIGFAQGIRPPNLFGALTAVFQADGGGGRSGLFQWDGREVRKIFASGDTVPEGVVQQWDPNVIADQGSYYARLGGPNFSTISRLSGGAWTKVVQSEQFGSLRIHGPNRLHDAVNGVLLFEANTDQGMALLRRSAGGTLEALLWHNGGPAGTAQWPGVSQAFLAQDNAVVFLGAAGSGGQGVQRLAGGAVTPVIAAGASTGLSGAVVLEHRNFTQAAAAAAGLMARTPSNGYARLGRESAAVVLSPGDALPDGAVVTFVGGGSANRAGEVIVHTGTAADQRLLLLADGRVTQLARTQDLRSPSGSSICCLMGQVALNNRRQWAAMVQPNGPPELLLFPGGGAAPRSVMNTSGQAFPNEVALDERGRVAWIANTGSGRELVVWDNGQSRTVLRIGDTIGTLRVDGMGSLRAAGERFFVAVNAPGANAVAEFDGSGWRIVIGTGNVTPFGTITNFCCTFAVNTAGDVALRANLDFAGEAAILHRRDGRDVLIGRSGRRLSNGEWLEEMRDLALADTGEAYLSARTSGAARFVVYRGVAQ